ncbi:MAG: arginine--tRNA ligase [Desulfomonilaceae bacterium]
MKQLVEDITKKALFNLFKSGEISKGPKHLPEFDISRSKDPKFGDFATNAALVLSKELKTKPRDLAAMIINFTDLESTDIEHCEVAGPGFINFFMKPSCWYKRLMLVHEHKDKYGHKKELSGPRVLVEFVSANPTGPLHVGHGRGAAVGDSLVRLLRAAGWNVDSEYYVNDIGNQMNILGRSLWFRFRQLQGEEIEFPENHYQGDYMKELAVEFANSPEAQQIRNLDEPQCILLASQYACRRILEGIQEDLSVFGVSYDKYFSERYLHESGRLQAALEKLKQLGKAEERDGALWFFMDGEQDEKDRVLVRATGEPTYFASDVAYHTEKIERGYDLLVDIWGSDHHGYVPRVKAAIEAFGFPSDKLKVLLVQFVNLIRDGQKISMSTRSGEFITLSEVLEEVGSDAARFFFLTKRSDSHLDFDLDLAKKQSSDNPVYYVQYAHARIASIFRIAQEKGIDSDYANADLNILSLPEEIALMKKLSDFPDVLSEAAQALEPHRVTFYLMELAELFHSYYHDNKVLTEDVKVKKARLFLVEAIRLVISNGLTILGVSSPVRM